MASFATNRLVVPAVGAVGLIGAVAYSRSASKDSDPAARARKKRDQEGLSGAGIGGNATSGGHEPGQTRSGTGDSERPAYTGAQSRDQLPSGGISGGEGGGRSNARAVEVTGKKSQTGAGASSIEGRGTTGQNQGGSPTTSASSSSSSSSQGKGSSGSLSQTLAGAFGQGGPKSQNRGEGEEMHNTVAASNHSETPSKKT